MQIVCHFTDYLYIHLRGQCRTSPLRCILVASATSFGESRRHARLARAHANSGPKWATPAQANAEACRLRPWIARV